MRIDAIHSRLLLVLDMAQAGYFSPTQRDEALDIASIDRFSTMLPLYGTSDAARTALSPFKTTSDFTTDDDGGFSIPVCERLTRCTIMRMEDGEDDPVEVDVEILVDDKVGNRLRSQLRAPSAMYPVLAELGERKFRVYPVGPSAGSVTYLKRPEPPVYAFSVNEEDQEVYDAANSVNLAWNDIDIDPIIFKAIAVLGVSLDNTMLAQAGAALARPPQA